MFPVLSTAPCRLLQGFLACSLPELQACNLLVSGRGSLTSRVNDDPQGPFLTVLSSSNTSRTCPLPGDSCPQSP